MKTLLKFAFSKNTNLLVRSFWYGIVVARLPVAKMDISLSFIRCLVENIAHCIHFILIGQFLSLFHYPETAKNEERIKKRRLLLICIEGDEARDAGKETRDQLQLSNCSQLQTEAALWPE